MLVVVYDDVGEVAFRFRRRETLLRFVRAG